MARVCYELSLQLMWAARTEEAVKVARRGLTALEERVIQVGDYVEGMVAAWRAATRKKRGGIFCEWR